MLADGKLQLEETPDNKNSFIELKGENWQLVCDRVFTSCWLFMMYCHATGFDPQPAIEAMIADFNVSFTFSDVNKKYQKDIKKGFYLRLKP